MKLTFVIGYLQGGGAEHVLASLSNSLCEKGHDVTLIYNFKNRDFELSEKIRQIDFCTIEYNTFEGNKFCRIYKKIANRFRDFIFFRKYIREQQPDVVTSFMRNRAETLYFACKHKVPLIFSEHSSMERQPVSRLDRYVRYKLMPKAAAVTMLTQYDKQYVSDTLKNAVVMPNALSFPPIADEEYDALFEKRKNILVCGRLTPIKGIDLSIEAFSKIADKYPLWNLDIAGKDIPGKNYSNQLKDLVIAKKLTGRVNFLGFKKDMKGLMKKYAIYCLSSRSEGFSLTLTEAMASGTASVSFALSGPLEIIKDNEDGILVTNQDVDQLAEGIETLICDSDLRYRLGKKALVNVKRFDREEIVERWEQLFLDLTRR